MLTRTEHFWTGAKIKNMFSTFQFKIGIGFNFLSLVLKYDFGFSSTKSREGSKLKG